MKKIIAVILGFTSFAGLIERPAHAAGMWDSTTFTSVSATCTDASGNALAHPVDYAKLIQTSGQIKLNFYRFKEGLTESADELTVGKSGKTQYTIKSLNYAGLGCMLQGCAEKVGVITLTTKAMDVEILPSFLNICRADNVAKQILHFSLTADSNDKSDPQAPQTTPVDNANDHLGPFISFARYADGQLELMTESHARYFCKDSRFVAQPARLANYDEMYTYAVSHGAKGILDKMRFSIYTKPSAPLTGYKLTDYDHFWDEYDTTKMMNYVLFDSTGYKSVSGPEFPNQLVWLSSPTKAFDLAKGKMTDLDPSHGAMATVGCVADQ